MEADCLLLVLASPILLWAQGFLLFLRRQVLGNRVWLRRRNSRPLWRLKNVELPPLQKQIDMIP